MKFLNKMMGFTNVTFGELTSKPTTLAGYGIIDAATSSNTHGVSDEITGTFGKARIPDFTSEDLLTGSPPSSGIGVNGDVIRHDDMNYIWMKITETRRRIH